MYILPFGWELESLYNALPNILDVDEEVPDIKKPTEHVQFKVVASRTMQFFYSGSLVCRGWTTISQKFLFSWITLFDSAQFDKFFHNLRSTDPSRRLLGYIQRISVRYLAPFFKFGEALPRIALLSPPNLDHIDICPHLAYGTQHILFPFHSSLPMRLSRLGQVCTLHFRNLDFQHSTELRQLICSFTGVRSIDHNLGIYDFAPDRLGEYRLVSPVGRPMSISCISPTKSPATAFPFAVWLPSLDLGSDTWKHTVGVPSLSRGVAEFLATLRQVLDSQIFGIGERWSWESHVGGQTPNYEQCW